jgi:hypothetical protein
LLYTSFKLLIFIILVESVYSAVRTDSLYKADNDSAVKVKVKHSLTGLLGPEGYGRLRPPDSVTSALEGGTLSAVFTPRNFLVLI